MQTNRASALSGTGMTGWGRVSTAVAGILLAALLPVSAARAQSAPAATETTSRVSECEAYPSGLLKGEIRICPGTVWPGRTERLVMPLMEANREKFKGKSVLDIGTGCGILALYAAQMGATKVVATDIETQALDCTLENSRRLGVDPAIEERLVSLQDPSAYSVIKPDEKFDIIVAFPYGHINRQPSMVDGKFDEGVTENDNTRFGFSIIDGLGDHLADNGVAILCYRFAVAHAFMVGYARHKGFKVEHHSALQISAPDWYALYNTFAAQVARTDGIPPRALMLPKPGSRAIDTDIPGFPGGPGSGAYVKVDYSAEAGVAFPRLWDTDLDRILPGIIVVRKQPPDSGSQ